MSSSTIPTNFDCVIIGTGLTNSILAAACSRIGKSVLHIDKNNYYGDDWASFTFQQILDWIKDKYPDDASLKSVPDELINKSRMFCIDLCPRLLYSNGAMVDLLVKSNVSRYHEFKNNIRILSMVDNEIHIMPCRRSDVFTSPLLSDLVDKRKFMKFIEMCIKFDPNQEKHETSDIFVGQANEPICKFLEDRGLKRNLREYIINSIAMVSPTETTRGACEKIKQFMIATERFGRSPFIFPLYGCGEFPQSFCRLSAVFGGVYCLNTQVDNVQSPTNPPDESSTSTLVNFTLNLSGSDKYEVKSDTLITDCANAMDLKLANVGNNDDCGLSRAILITKKSVVTNDENLISFLRIPPNDKNADTVFLLEFNSSVMVCPPDINIVYLWTKSHSTSAKQDLESTVEGIFGDDSQMIIWRFYYRQLTGCSQQDEPQVGIRGLHITSVHSDDIDYGHSIQEAERIFHKICPGQDFLPRAPDPDEIIN